MFLKPAHSNLCCPQASPSGRIRHPRARPTRRIVASSLLCVRGAEVESKPQRLEQVAFSGHPRRLKLDIARYGKAQP
uniref:Uncharacterized protein n=1 Tax=Phytophthora fragariae TaxID=53985 RepID=A0A6A3FZT4_9STRA|nr:hypothetical protein PF009_g664 [Phytophthora fragariae]